MQRVYEITDREGLLVSIRSDWISWWTRRPGASCGPAPSQPRSWAPAPRLSTPGAPGRSCCPGRGLEDLGARKVVWSDLDGNGHVYSGNYGDFVWDYLPADLQEKVPPGVLHQLQQGKPPLGQELRMVGCRKGGEYLMEGLGPEGVRFSAQWCFKMRAEPFSLGGMPALRWGRPSRRGILYLHGQGGSKAEAAFFGAAAADAGWQTVSVDLPGHGTGSQRPRLWSPGRWCRSCGAPWRSWGRWDRVGLFGSSLGPGSACWHIRRLAGALFLSPVVGHGGPDPQNDGLGRCQ